MTRTELLEIAKPILFNTEMTRAIKDNRKTATRRLVKGYALNHMELDTDGSIIGIYNQDEGQVLKVMEYAPYRPGDILYVRETWYYETFYEDTDDTPDLPSGNRSWRYVYKADNPDYPVIPGHWRPSIHMPKEAARIFLRVQNVRVERLQDMRLRHFLSEGVELLPGEYDTDFIDTAPRVQKYFENLWDSTIKPADLSVYGWDANPWVWVIGFEKMEAENA